MSIAHYAIDIWIYKILTATSFFPRLYADEAIVLSAYSVRTELS